MFYHFTAFAGQMGMGMAVWALNVVLFVAFSLLKLGRALCFPRSLLTLMRHPNQSLFVGAIPMAFNTIANGVVVFLIPRYVEGGGVSRFEFVITHSD
jgi:tellurite resistance protein TehA-like permease